MKKKELEQHLEHLAQLAQNNYQSMENIGVLGGMSGVALFQFYCSKHFDDDSYADMGVEIISRCVDKINNGYSYPTYCAGIAGFGWALEHLAENNFIELDLDELLIPFDDYLKSQMKLDLSNGYYDFLHGALGYGFYFLKRYLNTNQNVLKKKYLLFLDELVHSMEKLAMYSGNTIKWESYLDIKKNHRGYNLSLSHGMSSIIYFFCRLNLAGIFQERTSKLIQGATNFILNFHSSTKNNTSIFPNWVEPGKDLKYNSRLAWCYGDLGIGLALNLSGEALNNNKFHDKIKELFLSTSKRKTKNETLVVDSGYCHGSFGNAHIFYQLYRNDKNPCYLKASQFWLDDGLNKYSGDSNRPYLQWMGEGDLWNFELNVLMGISGIGLTIIDCLSKTQNYWDECLMLR